MRKSGLILLLSASLCMTACGYSVPEMTEEQNAQVVEYAAGLLLKYDRNYQGRLVEEPEEQQEEEQPEKENHETKGQETMKAEEETPLQEEEKENEAPVTETAEETAVYNSVDEFCGLDGVTITYTGYEVKDIYPDNSGEDMFFAMSAAKDSKLVVLEFDAVSSNGQEQEMDMLSAGTKFKIRINGGTPKYALTTMLMNDLASYTGTVVSDSAQQLVLVAELPQEDAQSIRSVSLIMRNASESTEISLN